MSDGLRKLHQALYAHLEERTCTALSPMLFADKDRFYWHHPSAVEVKPFFNLVLCECPHCGLTFTSFPRRG